MARCSSIQTTLNYGKEDGTRPFLYVRPRTEDDPHQTDSGGTSASVDIEVRDARLEELTLDKNSFQLVSQKTSLTTDDFYNDQNKIRRVYYKEMAETIKTATGATHVHMFHHQVRNAEKNTGDSKNLRTDVQGYAAGVHSDSHPHSAEALFLQMACNPDTRPFRTGRFMYINAWRNISDVPIGNDHLGVCDESSLVKPDDYITSDLFGEGYQIQQYRLNDRNSSLHRWYYYSRMVKDEVVLFKQWDSDGSLRGRVCFHTSFTDPNAPADTPCRQSIEARGIAYFPDHKPNTCPPLPEEAVGDGIMAEGEAADYAKKFIQMMDTLGAWPSAAKVWIKTEVAKGEVGIENIATTIVKDDGDFQGLKSRSPAFKKEIVQLMLSGNFGQRVKANAAKLGTGTLPKTKSSAAFHKAGLVVVGAILGWGLCRRYHA